MAGPWPACTAASMPSRLRPTSPHPVATTWVILRTSRLEGRVAQRLVAAVGQRLFAAAFLAGFDRRQVLAHLPVVVAARLADRNIRDDERRLLPRWPWARRLRLGVVRTNDQVLGFRRRMGFTDTGEVRPWRYGKLESESILMDKHLPPAVE